MDSENLTKVFNFESDIDEHGEIKIPREELKELREKGYTKVNIVLFGSSKNAAEDTGIDTELFEKIKNLQTLPDTVVLDFLKSKGALNKTSLEERIENG